MLAECPHCSRQGITYEKDGDYSERQHSPLLLRVAVSRYPSVDCFNNVGFFLFQVQEIMVLLIVS
jgi:hypothetical protein